MPTCVSLAVSGGSRRMKHNIPFLFMFLTLTALGLARATEVSEVGKPTFEAEFPSGGQLRLHIRSGDVTIRGSSNNAVKVHYEGSRSDQINDVRVDWKNEGSTGNLSISGGPRNNFGIIVEVPKDCDLRLRVFAGDVQVKDVSGNKDIELWAGDLTIDVGNPDDYRAVDASVRAGDLEAGPFHQSKGGMFRSFEYSGNGKYRLHAHTTFGDIELR